MNPPVPSTPDSHDPIAAAAGAWLARHDRGLSAAEQDAFSEWLAADARHRAEFARINRAWAALDSLAAWQPADGSAPNPDLLAPARPRRWWRRAAIAAAAAAAVIAFFLVRAPAPVADAPAALPGLRVIPRPERQALADGSFAEANHGARFELTFGAAERRLRLHEGEVHVSVARDAARPFVVDVDGAVVRAIGTAFSVRRERDAFDVLVTDGTVQVEQPGAAPVAVAPGERARVEPGRRPAVAAEAPEKISRDLAWRSVRLEFEALPLQAAVAEFNLRNSRQLAIGDPGAGRVKVGGTFRADEPEAFVRLLEAGFGIAVERRETGAWVLRSAPAKK